ncbi:MAG TPA: S9 family peptidase, partial [Candidatus Eisenbacteria bacterium]
QTVLQARDRYALDQWIADHGFVVVSFDGRGTPGRGRAWERAIRGKLGQVPLEDQVSALRTLTIGPGLDLKRVGIFGWSFGGYLSAMAAMRHPDVFRAAVAGAPVTDWLDYDTHYTERYLDLPRLDPQGYRANSVLTWAPDLKVPLMIVHGTSDDNVYFTNSLKLCDALFRAGKDFEFVPLPGFTHMVPDPVVTTRLYGRILTFFERHLGKGGPTP